MQVEGLTPVLPVDDLAAAVATFTELLGVSPTFVDGDRWAQFDLGPRRLALSGSDRVTDKPSLMLKVADLDAARETASGLGLPLTDVEEGPHELRCVTDGPGGWPLVLYSPKPS